MRARSRGRTGKKNSAAGRKKKTPTEKEMYFLKTALYFMRVRSQDTLLGIPSQLLETPY